jgi:hypothetical protein
MNWQDRISVDPRVPREGLHPGHPDHGVGDSGQPRRQRSAEGILGSYPTLRTEDVQAAIANAADLRRRG